MKREKTLVFGINVAREPNPNLTLLRVTITPEHTKLDMGYSAIRYYIKGGWIRISPKTHLRIQGSEEKFSLTKADNIPIAPNHHHFESTRDWQYFSLYFPPIPQEDCVIHLIEEENPTRNDFNIYDIQLNINDSKEIIQLF